MYIHSEDSVLAGLIPQNQTKIKDRVISYGIWLLPLAPTLSLQDLHDPTQFTLCLNARKRDSTLHSTQVYRQIDPLVCCLKVESAETNKRSIQQSA